LSSLNGLVCRKFSIVSDPYGFKMPSWSFFESELLDIWNSDAYKKFREPLSGEKRFAEMRVWYDGRRPV
jgi:hypothetical protein